MKIKHLCTLQYCVVSFFLYMCSLSLMASSSTLSDVLNIINIQQAKVGNENIKSFIVEANTEGYYYCNFWYMPSKKADGSLSTLHAYVNVSYTGEIVPTKEGWQSVYIKDLPSIKLSKGKNVISVSTEGAEMPLVETVRLSKNRQSAVISSAEYDAYMDEVAMSETQHNSNIASDIASDNIEMCTIIGNDACFTQKNVPLKYSFFNTYTLKKGDEIHISTNSVIQHAVDFFYMGKPIVLNNLLTSDYLASLCDFTISPRPDLELNYKLRYTPATSEEMQGLSWKRNADIYKDNSELYNADFYVKAPIDGLYMLKIRPNYSCALGSANITVEQKKDTTITTNTYSNVPIYNSNLERVIPADSCQYEITIDTCSAPGFEPMLFVEGNDGHRIVGFSDYYSKEKGTKLTQSYKINTSGIHVNNYISANPRLQCTVYCMAVGDAADALAMQKATYGRTTNNIEEHILANTDIKKDYNRFDVFAPEGTKILSLNSNELKSITNYISPGFYVVKAIRNDGKYKVFKITLK